MPPRLPLPRRELFVFVFLFVFLRRELFVFVFLFVFLRRELFVFVFLFVFLAAIDVPATIPLPSPASRASMTGKDPHRPQGKTKDMEHMAHAYAEHDVPRQAPSDKARAERDRLLKERAGGPTRVPAEEQVGGSRPGVPSRVKDAIEEREARE